MIRKLDEILYDLWTSDVPPRSAKRALVVLFAISAACTSVVIVGGAIEEAKIAIHSIHPQRVPAKLVAAQNVPS